MNCDTGHIGAVTVLYVLSSYLFLGAVEIIPRHWEMEGIV